MEAIAGGLNREDDNSRRGIGPKVEASLSYEKYKKRYKRVHCKNTCLPLGPDLFYLEDIHAQV